MPRYTTIHCPAGQWTQITDADVTALTFQLQGLSYDSAFVKCTADGTAPTDELGADLYRADQGERAIPLADLGLGVAAPRRVWVKPHVNAQRVKVGHA
ncbi:hypothetical protein [Roseicitreum antarcticum]|uniref:Uncharacterized protein n=1 Tax=Roseicitreum antarcticum TaxID=564137 RepID=A0A1H3EQQ4_9RHOB|nr:hypothetical protein [Roseicitreum antarcticum]SDX81103.1 hypothetical protein SAMN04488238_1253 [Roseicitreum antarcticum]